MKNEPLFTIIVVTYNSSKFVLSTLESIKSQTYQNIELIITDDCSTDDTVAICRTWLGKNAHRFCRTELINSPQNTGIPGNLNRGVKICTGEWIKPIAGDDLLLPNCCEDVICNVTPTMEAIVTPWYTFTETGKGIEKKNIYPENKYNFFFEKNSGFQNDYLLRRNITIVPGVFIRKSLYSNIGLYDERYRMFEDYPFFLKITENGIKFHKLNIKPTVLYRTNEESISHTQSRVFNTKFKECSLKFHKEVVYPKIKWWNIVYYQGQLMKWGGYWLIIHLAKNKRNILSNAINQLTSFLSLPTYTNKLYIKFQNFHNSKNIK